MISFFGRKSIMKNDIKISVILPIYNVKSYLKRSIDSILYQNFGNLEMILVDDGSTDGSSVILDEYEKKFENIKVIYQQNAGSGAAVMYVSDSLYCYRVRQSSITHTRSNKKSRDLLKVVESLSKTITNKFPEELVNFQVWRKPLDITVYYDCSILGWENADSQGQLFLRISNFDGNGLTVKQKIKLLLIKVKIVDLISYFLLIRRKY